jgi:hypothetical protein
MSCINGLPLFSRSASSEGHGFLNEENRFAFYGAMERFLAENTGPASGQAVVESGFNSEVQHSAG